MAITIDRQLNARVTYRRKLHVATFKANDALGTAVMTAVTAMHGEPVAMACPLRKKAEMASRSSF